MDDVSSDPPRTWQLSGDQLIEEPGKNVYKVVSLDQHHLVLQGDRGKVYSHERIETPRSDDADASTTDLYKAEVGHFLQAIKAQDYEAAYSHFTAATLEHPKAGLERFIAFIKADHALSAIMATRFMQVRTHRGVGLVQAKITNAQGESKIVDFELLQETGSSWKIEAVSSDVQFPEPLLSQNSLPRTVSPAGDPSAGYYTQGNNTEPTPIPSSASVKESARDPEGWATGSWSLVLYKGKKIPYQLPLPGYWHLMKQPLDANADASWMGPRGIVLTAYSYDDNDPDDLLDALKKVDRITGIREYKPDHKLPPDKRDDKFFMIDAQPVGNLTLFGVYIIKIFDKGHKFLALSEKIPASGQGYGVEGGPIGTDVGIAVTQMKALANGGAVNLTQRVTAKNDAVLAALTNTARPQNSAPAVAAAPALLTKAQWKEKMARNFRWYPGTPVIGAAAQFQQVMGKPDRTQTVGDQAYWYYQCSDGTIQLVMNVLNLQVAGFLQADVNDF